MTPVIEPFHCTLPPVNPFPFTVRVKLVPPAFASTGEMDEMCGPVKEKLFSTMVHTPRPCVDATRVREAACSLRESTATRGRPVLKTDHVQVVVQVP